MDISPVSQTHAVRNASPEATKNTQPVPKFEMTTLIPNGTGLPLAESFGNVFQIMDDAAKKCLAETARLEEKAKELRAAGVHPGSPEWTEFNAQRMSKFLELQMEMGRAAMGVEIAAKVVEHGTSGAKTVLQTQA